MITFICHVTLEQEGLIIPDIINAINEQYPDSKIIIIDQNYILDLNDVKATVLDLPNIKNNDTADWTIRFLNVWLGTEPKDNDLLIKIDPDTKLISTVNLSGINNGSLGGSFIESKKSFQGGFQVYTPQATKALIFPLKKLNHRSQDVMLYTVIQQLKISQIELEGLNLDLNPKTQNMNPADVKVYHPDKHVKLLKKRGKTFSSGSLKAYVTNRVQRLSA